MGKDQVKSSLGIIGVDHGGVSIYIYKYSGIHLPSNRWAIHHEQKYCPCGWEILFVAPSSA